MAKRIIITDLGTGRLAGMSDRQRLISSAEYRDLPDDLLEKIDSCMQAEEPFGLQNGDGVVVFLPKDLAAAWYDRELTKTVQRVGDKPSFVFMLTGVLYTHKDFLGPLMVHKFITAVKVLQDANLNIVIPDPALSEPGQPAGPLETGS